MIKIKKLQVFGLTLSLLLGFFAVPAIFSRTAHAATQSQYNSLATFVCTQTSPNASDACGDRIRVEKDPTQGEVNSYCFRSGQSQGQGVDCVSDFSSSPSEGSSAESEGYYGDRLDDLINNECPDSSPVAFRSCSDSIRENGATSSQVSSYCADAAQSAGRFNDTANLSCLRSFTNESQENPIEAQTPGGGSDSNGQNGGDSNNSCADPADCPDVEEVQKSKLNTASRETNTDVCNNTSTNGSECLENLPIMIWINRILTVMTIIVIPLITLVLVVGGVQYSMATGDPGKVSAAKQMITKGGTAFVCYIVMWAFLQWLVPGGVF